MENLIISVNAILPMFLVMALGYGARCLGWIRREEILNINKIAFRIFLPCLLFYNVYCSDLSGSFDPLLIAYAVGGVLVSFALALGYTLLTEKLPERRGVMIQGMFRSNYVIMGIPVATALLGADQLGTVSILIAIIVPIFNMMSIIVLEVFRGQKPKPLHILGQIAKNPLVIASVLGVLALVAKIRLPYILEKTVQSVSGIASPLQLFLLGAFFQFSGLRRYVREPHCIRSRVNGELRQDSTTDLMIFHVAYVIAELSRGMTLLPGTIISMGTPAGVGMGFDPPKWLHPGDEVACSIEGIGTLTNTVR